VICGVILNRRDKIIAKYATNEMNLNRLEDKFVMNFSWRKRL